MADSINKQDFEIHMVKAAPLGAKYIARVAFAFMPSGFQPLLITHRGEKADGWHTYTDAEIDGAQRVRVQSAFLRESKKGELFIQTTGLDVPWDLSRAVAEAAFQRLQAEKGYDQ